MNPDKKTMRRAKVANYTLLAIVVLLLIFLLTTCGGKRFTADKWLRNPEKRIDMLSDLLERHDLIGQTEDEVIALLSEDFYYRDFAGKEAMVYNIGSLSFSLDSAWLLLYVQDGIVTDYEVAMD